MIPPEARRKKLTLGCSVQDPRAGTLYQAREALPSIQSWAKLSLFKQFLGFWQQTGESGGGDRKGRGNYLHWNSSSLLGHWPTTEQLCGPSTSLCCLPYPLVPKVFWNLQEQKRPSTLALFMSHHPPHHYSHPPHPRSRSIGASVSVFPGSSLTLLLSNFFNVYQSYGFNWHWDCGLLVRLNTFPHGHCDLKFHSYELLVHSFPPVFYCLSFANYYICCKYFSLFYLLLFFF